MSFIFNRNHDQLATYYITMYLNFENWYYRMPGIRCWSVNFPCTLLYWSVIKIRFGPMAYQEKGLFHIVSRSHIHTGRVPRLSSDVLFPDEPVAVPDYVPVFQEAVPVFSAPETATCGNDTFCLFDLRVTGDDTLAGKTKEISGINKANRVILGEKSIT